jgi:hypothetical protein
MLYFLGNPYFMRDEQAVAAAQEWGRGRIWRKKKDFMEAILP